MGTSAHYLGDSPIPAHNWSESVTAPSAGLSRAPPASLDYNEASLFGDNSQFQTLALADVIEGLLRMFYIVDVRKTTFETVQEVPAYFKQSWPYFILFMVLENILLLIEKRPTLRLNDSITSISHGILQECGRLLFRGGESFMYMYIYENFRLIDMPWQHPATWYLAAIGVDFCYYWVHRACHEVHILWAQHQVHHSSEEFNLAVGLRQSALQGWCGFLFYLPLALVLPPSHFIAHQQFNILYQFWIHTETVESLGPLEYVFNSPKHHRVHHGSNIYCLDKNYGGVLIIWDRIFGTFADEKSDEEIIYGLVFNQPSFNVLHLQTFYSRYVIEKFREMNTWANKFRAIFYGPSWQPGKPRLGLEQDKIKVVKREKYNMALSIWCNVYLLTHFTVVIVGFHYLVGVHMTLSAVTLLLCVLYVMGSLCVIGLMFDDKPYACVLELFRCMVLVTVIQRLPVVPYHHLFDTDLLLAAEVFYLVSGLFWLLKSCRVLQISISEK